MREWDRRLDEKRGGEKRGGGDDHDNVSPVSNVIHPQEVSN